MASSDSPSVDALWARLADDPENEALRAEAADALIAECQALTSAASGHPSARSRAPQAPRPLPAPSPPLGPPPARARLLAALALAAAGWALRAGLGRRR